MSNTSTITTGGIAVAKGNTGVIQTTSLPTITAGSPGQVLTSSITGSPFSFANPTKNFKAGTLTIKAGDGNEEAEIDAAFINDLKLLMEIIQEVPDEHPLGDLKHDMRNRRAFKKLGG
jgi:hypothetical protein